MKLFISRRPSQIGSYPQSVGVLVTTKHPNRAVGRSWAIDNRAFVGFDESGFRRLLTIHRGNPDCTFVVAPDVVANAQATLRQFALWRDVLGDYPAALAAQDGLTVADVPWSEIAALFVGGSTEWKLGDGARELIEAAHVRGKWVHVGRVNTIRRIRYFQTLPVDSIDGSGWARFPKYAMRLLWPYLEHRQLTMGEIL